MSGHRVRRQDRPHDSSPLKLATRRHVCPITQELRTRLVREFWTTQYDNLVSSATASDSSKLVFWPAVCNMRARPYISVWILFRCLATGLLLQHSSAQIGSLVSTPKTISLETCFLGLSLTCAWPERLGLMQGAFVLPVGISGGSLHWRTSSMPPASARTPHRLARSIWLNSLSV